MKWLGFYLRISGHSFVFFFLESEHSLGARPLALKLECQVDGHPTSNSSTQEVGTERLLLGQGQPGLHSEIQAYYWSYTKRLSLKIKPKMGIKNKVHKLGMKESSNLVNTIFQTMTIF